MILQIIGLTLPIDIFDVVQAGEAEYGVVPFENSTHGPVMFTLDNLADRNSVYTDLSVCGEIYLDVHHFLLGHKSPVRSLDESLSPGQCTPTATDPNPLRPRAKPLSSLKHITRIYSHPQGFGQTVAFLSTYLKGVDQMDVSSTSRAAQLASEDKTGQSAAIASELAAEMHGLDVLARCIEDRDDNTTRFFIIHRGAEGGSAAEPKLGAPAKQQGAAAAGAPGSARYKSLVSFTVPHKAPGALADVLDVFKKYKLNLTSINSLPSLIQPFQYLFLVEFEGSKLDDPDGMVKGALEEVHKVAQSWRWLGSWDNQRA